MCVCACVCTKTYCGYNALNAAAAVPSVSGMCLMFVYMYHPTPIDPTTTQISKIVHMTHVIVRMMRSDI